jgi:hypothetical protein
MPSTDQLAKFALPVVLGMTLLWAAAVRKARRAREEGSSNR